MKKNLVLFCFYMRMHIKSILMLIAFSAVFISVFYLAGVSVHIYGYAAVICAFIGLIFTAVDFIQFYIRHSALDRVKNTASHELSDLPKPRNLIERDYENILNKLSDENRKLVSETEASYSNMNDYYIFWVHQIKTPIAAIRLLLQTNPDTDAENFSEISSDIETELFKIEQYVGMVLTYLKINGSSSDLVIKKYKLDGIIRSAVRKYSKLFIKKHLTLLYEPTDAEIITDEKWLSVIIEQLLSNALKYTESGNIRIYTEKTDGGYKLNIADTGIGIAAEDLPRIFESGFTGYNGRKDRKSTGLGLYLCGKISKMLSHKLYAVSEDGKGSVFSVEFTETDILAE